MPLAPQAHRESLVMLEQLAQQAQPVTLAQQAQQALLEQLGHKVFRVNLEL